MTKEKVMYYLDFVPIVILTISAINLVWTIFNTDTVFAWKHYLALFILPINYFLFWWKHKLGVVGLGLTIILGLLSFLSFDPAISTYTVSMGKEGVSIPVFYGQPIFLLWFIIYFVLSVRHYVGVLTQKYWQELFHNLSKRSV